MVNSIRFLQNPSMNYSIESWLDLTAVLGCVSLQMKEGRRTSSMKASYEAIKNDILARDLASSRESSGYMSSTLASTLTQNLTTSNSSDSRAGRKSK